MPPRSATGSRTSSLTAPAGRTSSSSPRPGGAVAGGDAQLLERDDRACGGVPPSAERRLETLAQGAAFLTATQAVWPHAELEPLGQDGREVAYPVAVGACAAAHGLPLAPTAQAFAQAFAANIVSAGVRLIPLGQTDGLRVLARLEPLIPRMVAGALACGSGRRRRRGNRSRHCLHAPRDPIHATVPVMIVALAISSRASFRAIAVLHADWGLGGVWPAAERGTARQGGRGHARHHKNAQSGSCFLLRHC